MIERDEARKRLGLPLDKFIVFNGNRNQPRKLIDQTIKAFAEFAKDKEDALLYLNMGEKDLGWAITELFETEMRRRGADPTAKLAVTPGINYMAAPPDEQLNLIYNAVDIGINTANGEGWDLSHSSMQCAKNLKRTGSYLMSGIWKDKDLYRYGDLGHRQDLGVERGIINYKHAAELIQKLYEDEEYRKK